MNTKGDRKQGQQKQQKEITLGSKTKYGTISAMAFIGGERYYFMVKNNLVSMIPANAL